MRKDGIRPDVDLDDPDVPLMVVLRGIIVQEEDNGYASQQRQGNNNRQRGRGRGHHFEDKRGRRKTFENNENNGDGYGRGNSYNQRDENQFMFHYTEYYMLGEADYIVEDIGHQILQYTRLL